MRFILASTSSRRRDLLRVFGLPFDVQSPSEVDEALHMPDGAHTITEYKRFTGRLSRIKAESVKFSEDEDILVLGADTIVILDGLVLGKPVDEDDAMSMLRRLSGKSHHVITGMTLIRGNELAVTGSEVTRVTFKPLTDEEIHGYVRTGEPLDKAGAYGIQGVGGLFVTGIEGCYYNVVGLPLASLYRMLVDFGVKILA